MGRPVRRSAARGALRALGVQGRLHAVFGQGKPVPGVEKQAVLVLADTEGHGGPGAGLQRSAHHLLSLKNLVPRGKEHLHKQGKPQQPSPADPKPAVCLPQAEVWRAVPENLNILHGKAVGLAGIANHRPILDIMNQLLVRLQLTQLAAYGHLGHDASPQKNCQGFRPGSHYITAFPIWKGPRQWRGRRSCPRPWPG